MAWRGTCSTGVVRVGDKRVRVAWTSAGVAFADEDERGLRLRVEKRLKMHLVEREVPASIRKALAVCARRPGCDDVPIDLSWARGFERDVLLAARSIPWGQTRPYSWLAREARRPLAVRAAASVIARNPLWLLVPWHRVIYKDGKTGPGGLGAHKRRLLAKERAGVRRSEPRR